MREWQELRDQLAELSATQQLRDNQERCSSSALHQALLSGFLDGIGVRDEGRTYLGARGTRFTIAPGTPLARRLPHWVVSASLVETDRLYARMVAQVQPSWIESAGAHLVKRQHTAAEWSRERGMVLASETTTLFGRVLSSGRRVDFATIDAAVAHRIFVEEALLRGQSTLRAPFLERNAALLDSIAKLEARLRRRDLTADDATLADFYASRIPVQVSGVRSFEKWSRTSPERAAALEFPLEIAASGPLPVADPSRYPDELLVGESAAPLEYVYDPTRDDDGITVRLPLALLAAASPARFEWLIPGYLRDKVIGLMRGMPKEIRRALWPIPEAADDFCAATPFGAGSLYAQLAAFVTQRAGVAIDGDALRRIPRAPWLDFRIRVLAEDGSTWGEGRDLARLRDDPRLSAGGAPLLASPWHRDDVRRWDFGEWPTTVDVPTAGMTVRMHAGIEDAGTSVRLRTYATSGEARDASRRGLTRLIAFELTGLREQLRRDASRDRDFVLLVAAAGFGNSLIDELADRAIADAVLGDGEPLPRTQAEFADAVERGRGQVHEAFVSARRIVTATLEQLRLARSAAAALTGPDAAKLQASMDAHLDRLFAPGWVRDTPRTWFERLARYAQAATRRAELASTRRARHAALESQVAAFDARLRELDLQAPASAGGAARQELRWMIEELRISLYAQELRTLRPVSAQRLDALVDAARREASGG
jgi:ATP-dependent helicase HrpA